MRIKEEINKCKELVDFDKEMLVHMMAEALNKHFDNERLDQDEMFLCGLRYSEFLTNGSSDKEYVAAESRRIKYLDKIGITPDYVRITLKDLYGIS